MGSKKRSARERERAAFTESLARPKSDSSIDALFTREDAHRQEMERQHEAALRYKACERKQRYATRAEAQDAVRDCKRHGSRDLHVYPCPYCNGWHLTHKPAR